MKDGICLLRTCFAYKLNGSTIYICSKFKPCIITSLLCEFLGSTTINLQIQIFYSSWTFNNFPKGIHSSLKLPGMEINHDLLMHLRTAFGSLTTNTYWHQVLIAVCLNLPLGFTPIVINTIYQQSIIVCMVSYLA